MSDLPLQVPSKFDVPLPFRGLYVRDQDTFRLTPGGRLLRKLRTMIEDYTDLQYAPSYLWGRKPAVIDQGDWAATLSAASMNERRQLLRLLAAERVAVKR